MMNRPKKDNFRKCQYPHCPYMAKWNSIYCEKHLKEYEEKEKHKHHFRRMNPKEIYRLS